MILSHKYKFIFIKTQKTAGTSIEIALSRFCGEHDIITPISPDDEALRKQLGYRGPQNYRFHSKDGKDFPLFNHVGAKRIRMVVGKEVWQNYFKFCFERNPWDKVLSWYFYLNKEEPRPNLSEFIQAGHGNLVGGPGGFDIYSRNGDVVVDRVCLYENLEQEMHTSPGNWVSPRSHNYPGQSQYSGRIKDIIGSCSVSKTDSRYPGSLQGRSHISVMNTEAGNGMVPATAVMFAYS